MCSSDLIISTFFVKAKDGGRIMNALYRGLIVAGLLSAIAFYYVTQHMMSGLTIDGVEVSAMNIFYAALVGLGVTAAMVVITEYYTATEYKPVRHIAQSCTTGHATNMIAGLGVSMKSTAAPVLVICFGIWSAFGLAGLYGIAVAATDRKSTRLNSSH